MVGVSPLTSHAHPLTPPILLSAAVAVSRSEIGDPHASAMSASLAAPRHVRISRDHHKHYHANGMVSLCSTAGKTRSRAQERYQKEGFAANSPAPRHMRGGKNRAREHGIRFAELQESIWLQDIPLMRADERYLTRASRYGIIEVWREAILPTPIRRTT